MRRRRWLLENAEAITEYNDLVAKWGTFSGRRR